MKRLLLALLLLGAAFRANAVDYTDAWYKSTEPGYGFSILETDDGTGSPFMYILFFIYGTNGSPTWYSAELRWDGVDRFSGPLYVNIGTFFGVPWIPGNSSQGQAGTASFVPNPNNNYQATISYTATNVGSATTPVVRLSLTSMATGGDYLGGQTGMFSGCNTAANNGSYTAKYDLHVTHHGNGDVTYAFTFPGGLTCQFTGTYVQHGKYYNVPNAAYTCSDGTSTTAQITEIFPTPLGIEARFTAPGGLDNCTESAFFGGPLVEY